MDHTDVDSREWWSDYRDQATVELRIDLENFIQYEDGTVKLTLSKDEVEELLKGFDQ